MGMKLTAVFEPAKEGGYTCFVEEIPAAISEGDTLEDAKSNLLGAKARSGVPEGPGSKGKFPASRAPTH